MCTRLNVRRGIRPKRRLQQYIGDGPTAAVQILSIAAVTTCIYNFILIQLLYQRFL